MVLPTSVAPSFRSLATAAAWDAAEPTPEAPTTTRSPAPLEPGTYLVTVTARGVTLATPVEVVLAGYDPGTRTTAVVQLLAANGEPEWKRELGRTLGVPALSAHGILLPAQNKDGMLECIQLQRESAFTTEARAPGRTKGALFCHSRPRFPNHRRARAATPGARRTSCSRRR